MGAVRGRSNRTTELKMRMGLVRSGISGWQSNRDDLPGKPDFYFSSEKLAIFVDGCFWHGCEMCGHIPKTNQEFWRAKIERNRQRHEIVSRLLEKEDIQSIRFWEHELKHDLKTCIIQVKNCLDSSLDTVP